MDASAETVCNWENGKTDPPTTVMPAILRFLGYDPFSQPLTLGERMRAKRRATGWTIREAAKHLGVNGSTWGDWERTGVVPWERHRVFLEAFLQDHSR